jgi:hypothetical protein
VREVLFAEALEKELRSRGVAFERGELLEYVEEIWVGVKRNPEISVWADRFVPIAVEDVCTQSGPNAAPTVCADPFVSVSASPIS